MKLCSVFDEIKRALKPTGTCWVNMGDTYASKGMRNSGFNERWHGTKYRQDKQGITDKHRPARPKIDVPAKSLCAIPFRFALEMINRGWVLRNVIVWHKPNCMPSSVKDRFTIDFEYLFFFSKSPRYWFEPQYEPFHESTLREVEAFQRSPKQWDPQRHKGRPGSNHNPFQIKERICKAGLHPSGRNKRCVWSIPTQAFSGKHFATFPERLVQTPISAGCPQFICESCGRPRTRIFKPTPEYGRLLENNRQGANSQQWFPGRRMRLPRGKKSGAQHRATAAYVATGYSDCGCGARWKPGIVLDPFFGSGTAGLVALKLGRRFIGIELNRHYIRIAKRRLAQRTPKGNI